MTGRVVLAASGRWERMYAARLKGTRLFGVVLVAVAAVLATCVLALVAMQEPAEAAYPGHNGRIAWVRGDGNNPSIFTMNPDGTDVRPLTASDPKFYSIDPAWSPDGTKVAYLRGDFSDGDEYDVFVLDVESGQETRITNLAWRDMQSPTWSADGTKIAFLGCDSPLLGCDIYVIDSDGSGLKNLTNTPQEAELYPVWSPDGSKFAFASYSTCDDGCEGDIYVMSADGSGKVNLTNETTQYADNISPDWSPDGTKIAFVHRSYRFPNTHLNQDIYVMNADGSGKVNVTNTPSTSDYHEGEADPAWSPDGTKIAYRWTPSSYSGGQQSFRDDVYVMNADGSGKVNLTKSPEDVPLEGAPDWQPLPGPASPTTKAQCKQGGYENFGFKNQGRCVAFVEKSANTNK